jgi:histidinol-phosphate/aromatic aminotransferase/cobyric acid decarboxylase-like protein
MTLSRRKFVQTAGIGAGAALTSNIWGRGRENSIWSAIEPDLQAVERNVICIASNENPVGPGKAVLDTLRSLLEGGAKPGRYSNQSGQLTEAIAAHFKVKPDNVLVSEGSTEILRAATQVLRRKPRRSWARSDLRVRRYAELLGHPVKGVTRLRFKLDVDKMAAARARGWFLLQPEQPHRHLRRRQGDACVPREAEQHIA